MWIMSTCTICNKQAEHNLKYNHRASSLVHISIYVDATFNFVAKIRQQHRTSFSWNFVLWTKSKQIEHVQFVSTLSKGQNFVWHCCQNRQQCRSNVRLCRKNRSNCSIWQCCFDIVAGVTVVWTGLQWVMRYSSVTVQLLNEINFIPTPQMLQNIRLKSLHFMKRWLTNMKGKTL